MAKKNATSNTYTVRRENNAYIKLAPYLLHIIPTLFTEIRNF